MILLSVPVESTVSTAISNCSDIANAANFGICNINSTLQYMQWNLAYYGQTYNPIADVTQFIYAVGVDWDSNENIIAIRIQLPCDCLMDAFLLESLIHHSIPTVSVSDGQLRWNVLISTAETHILKLWLYGRYAISNGQYALYGDEQTCVYGNSVTVPQPCTTWTSWRTVSNTCNRTSAWYGSCLIHITPLSDFRLILYSDTGEIVRKRECTVPVSYVEYSSYYDQFHAINFISWRTNDKGCFGGETEIIPCKSCNSSPEPTFQPDSPAQSPSYSSSMNTSGVASTSTEIPTTETTTAPLSIDLTSPVNDAEVATNNPSSSYTSTATTSPSNRYPRIPSIDRVFVPFEAPTSSPSNVGTEIPSIASTSTPTTFYSTTTNNAHNQFPNVSPALPTNQPSDVPTHSPFTAKLSSSMTTTEVGDSYLNDDEASRFGVSQECAFLDSQSSILRTNISADVLVIENMTTMVYHYHEGFREKVHCNAGDICYVSCVDSFSCLEVEILALSENITDVIIECIDKYSCYRSKMQVYGAHVEQINVICIGIGSCESMKFIASTPKFANLIITCEYTESCLYLDALIKHTVGRIDIHCMNTRSCQGMVIDGGAEININMIMYSYSGNITIIHPDIDKINTTCLHSDRRMLRYDTQFLMDEERILEFLHDEQNESLSCEGISINCGSNTCQMQYRLDFPLVDFMQIIATRASIDCYWINVQDLFVTFCDGNCGYNNSIHNISQEFEIILHANDIVSVCFENFGSINDTINTLNNLDAMFEVILLVISRQNESIIHNILQSPNSILNEAVSSIDCNAIKDNLQLNFDLNFVIESEIENEVILTAILFGDNTIFLNMTKVVLAVYFNTTTAIDLVNKEYKEISNGIAPGAIIAIATAVISFILSLILCIGCCLWDRHKKREKMTKYLHNPLVISIGIEKYDKDRSNSEFEGMRITDLAGIGVDITNVAKLFQTTLNYCIHPEYDTRIEQIKLHWTKQEIINLLRGNAKYLEYNIGSDHTKPKHDGLIVIISSHGLEYYIATSDHKKINKDTIHRIFSVECPSLRNIPRIFIYDCCDGINNRRKGSRAESIGTETEFNQQLNVKKENIMTMDAYGHNEDIWFEGEANPDYNLVIINASNTGFVSNVQSEEDGSFLTKFFVKYMLENIEEKRNRLFLYEVMHKIQGKLHKHEIQLISTNYNNKLEYIKFRRNDHDNTDGRTIDTSMGNDDYEIKIDDENESISEEDQAQYL